MRVSARAGHVFTGGLVLSALIAANSAIASAHGARWRQMLLTPLQAQGLQQGSDFHYYDRPAVRKGRWRVGSDQLCSKSDSGYSESILGDLPATEHPEDLSLEIDAFATAAAAHATFRCLSRETYNFAHGGDFDLRNLQTHVGAESFGGGGDNNPVGAVRSGRYIIWIQIENGYGPIGDLMQAEAELARRYG